MKKKAVVYLVSILLIGLICYASFVTRVFTKRIQLQWPINFISNNFSTTPKVVKWLAPFSNLDTSAITFPDKEHAIANNNKLEILQATALQNLIRVSNDKEQLKFLLTLLPDTGYKVNVEFSYESTWLKKMVGNNALLNQSIESFEGLKDFFVDSKKMYGYHIEMSPVMDTCFLFSQKIVPSIKRGETMVDLFANLINHAEQVKADFKGVRIFYLLPVGHDSVSVNVAVGVSNSSIEDSHAFGQYIFKRMPFQKNLLSCYYQGKFSGIKNVYAAMEKYKTDNGLKSMAIPFTKLITAGTDFSDDQVVQATVYYPVY